MKLIVYFIHAKFTGAGSFPFTTETPGFSSFGCRQIYPLILCLFTIASAKFNRQIQPLIQYGNRAQRNNISVACVHTILLIAIWLLSLLLTPTTDN